MLVGVVLFALTGTATAASAASPNFQLKAFNLYFHVGELSNTNSCIPAWVTARYWTGTVNAASRLWRADGSGCSSDVTQLQNWGDFQNTHSDVTIPAEPAPGQDITVAGLTTLTLTVTTPNTPPGRQKNVEVTSFVIWGEDIYNNWYKLVDDSTSFTFQDGHNDHSLTVLH
ncbi:hypothetical protein [Fodinicola feengrottensis]|uniref:hypothetical protein n=1 Tax=Fodinicola feengrottensis TaxID=435914 RepID=UPI0031D554B5